MACFAGSPDPIPGPDRCQTHTPIRQNSEHTMLKFDPQHCFARGGTEGDNILQDAVHRGSSKGAQMCEVSKGAILRSSGPSSGLIRQISAGPLVKQAERLVEKMWGTRRSPLPDQLPDRRKPRLITGQSLVQERWQRQLLADNAIRETTWGDATRILRFADPRFRPVRT